MKRGITSINGYAWGIPFPDVPNGRLPRTVVEASSIIKESY